MTTELTFTTLPDGPVLVGASERLLGQLLLELEEEMARSGAPLTASQGLSEDEVRAGLSSIQLQPPPELLVWFGWHNGSTAQATRGSTPHLPNFSIASLSDAIERYRATVQDFTPPEGLDPDFFDSGAGAGWLRLGRSNIGLAVECNTLSAPRIHFATEDFNEAPANYRAVSLCTFVGWRIYGLRSGAYRWNAHSQNWVTDVSRLHETQVTAAFW